MTDRLESDRQATAMRIDAGYASIFLSLSGRITLFGRIVSMISALV